MTSEILKETEVCKIYLVQDQGKPSFIKKEFNDLNILNKEFHISTTLKCSIKVEKDNNSLTYPYLKSLKKFISKTILPEPDALKLMTQCCEILKELKDLQIVHRDLKPGNLYLNDKQKLFVSDFETAISTDWPANERTCGTPGFMAPEQYSNSNVNWLADQYSMGVIFYNILSGTLPFSGDNIEEIRSSQLSTVPDPSLINTKLKKPFADITVKMMNPDKDLRFQSIEEIQQDLEKCRQSLIRNEILEADTVKIIPVERTITKKSNLTFNILIMIIALILVVVLFKSL